MTEQTQPTDAELRAWVQSLIADDDSVRTNDERDHMSFARAVLAKWGTPAGAGEPIGYINRGIAPHTEGKVVFHEKPTENLEGRWWTPDQPVFATPQPTQEQAGAVPLHASVVKRIWDECRVQGLDYVAFAWRIQRAAIEANHGTKGADHVS